MKNNIKMTRYLISVLVVLFLFALNYNPAIADTSNGRLEEKKAAHALISNGADATTIRALFSKTASLPTNQALQIFSRLKSLQSQGLPVDLVANKFNEGLAKRVRFQLIESATKKLGAKLLLAQRLCAGLPAENKNSHKLITNVARQLNYGQSERVMSRVINAYAEAGNKDPGSARTEQVMAGLGAMASMTGAGYSGEDVGNFVSSAVKNNYSGSDIERLGRILSMARSEGLADNSSLREITQERVRFGARTLIRSFGVSASQTDPGGKRGQQLNNSHQGSAVPTRPMPSHAVDEGKIKDDNSSSGIGHGVSDDSENSSGGHPPAGNNQPPGQQH
jgi:hypothetical protein